MTNPNWNLRYASHLGYRSPDAPLFPKSAGSINPIAQVEFAAALGLAGVQYALAVTRPAAEVEKVASALTRYGLEAGCILYSEAQSLARLRWGSADLADQEACRSALLNAIEVAKRLNAKTIAILSGVDPRLSTEMQIIQFAENLRGMADATARAGVTLCLETLSRRSLPGILLGHIAEAYAIVKAVNHPAVRLIFDTSHVQIMDGDLLENLRLTWDAIAIVQIADNPGRLEPGTGEINFDNLLRALHRGGYRGLVELEHNWSAPGQPTEQCGIDNLRRMDGRLLEII